MVCATRRRYPEDDPGAQEHGNRPRNRPQSNPSNDRKRLPFVDKRQVQRPLTRYFMNDPSKILSLYYLYRALVPKNGRAIPICPIRQWRQKVKKVTEPGQAGNHAKDAYCGWHEERKWNAHRFFATAMPVQNLFVLHSTTNHWVAIDTFFAMNSVTSCKRSVGKCP